MVRVFKGLEDKRKSYYAVIGAFNVHEAMIELSRYTKQKFERLWGWRMGTIAPYEKGVDGLWFAKDNDKGQSCIIVFK